MKPTEGGVTKIRPLIVLSALVFVLLWLFASAQTGAAGPLAQTDQATPTPAGQSVDDVATPLPGVPVELGGKVIFYVRERLGSLSPSQRAQLIQVRLNDLVSNPFAPPPDLKLVESPDGIDIISGDTLILTISERDVHAAGIDADLETTAKSVVQLLDEEIIRARELNTPQARLYRIGETLIFLLFLILVIVVINRVYHRMLRYVDDMPKRIREDSFWYTIGLSQSPGGRRAFKLLLNLIRILFILIILIVFVPLALRAFPRTRLIAEEFIQLLLVPLISLWSWFLENQDNLLTIALIIFVTYLLRRINRAFFSEISDGTIRVGNFDPEWAPFTSRIISFLLIIGAAVVAFPYLPGSDSEALRGMSIFLGALFTLSSTAAVTNIVAGVIQTYTGAFRVGDMVKIGDTTGIIIQKRLITTLIRTTKNEEVSIPNASVLSTNVVNYTAKAQDTGLVLYTTITIGYDVPWKQVHDLMIAAALVTPDVESEPSPFVLQTSLNDYNVAYQINCYTRAPERMPRIYSNLHQNIQDKFNDAGVEILSPAYASLRDGNTITIPENYRPEDYEVPGFQIETKGIRD